MTFKPSSTRSTALALAIAGVLSGAAHAQTTTLEEIIVTAERREQNVQDIPTAATVLTADALRDQGVDNITDIQQVAPGVAIQTYNRGTFVNIRGVGIAQSAPTSVPGVATYIDGVYIPHETFIGHSFYDIGSIEVLRGPQGTLTGQNSTGGAIYIRTPNVDMTEFSGYVDQTVADYSWYRTVAAVNVPMGSMLGARIAATYNTTDSYTKNIGGPAEPGSSELKSARVALRFIPFETLSFDLRYEHFDLQSGYNAIKNRYDIVTSDPFTIEENALSFLDQKGYRASVEGKWDITSGVQLRAITSKLDADNIDQADGDRRTTTAPATNSTGVARVGYTSQSFDTQVTELNLLSIGENKVNWVLGAFYMEETTPVLVVRDQTSNGGNPITLVTPVATSRIDAKADNTSKSVFGQFDTRFAESFELDVGLRYSMDRQDYMRYSIPGAPPPGCFPCMNTQDSTETTGRVAGKYYLSDLSMLYVSVSKGYKAGGVNLDPRLAAFGPETNEVGEFGVKTIVADGKLRVNGNVFLSNYDGIQLSALTPVVGSATPVPNTLNGKAKSYGAEVELTGQFDQLGFNLGLAYLNATFDGDQLFTNSETGLNEVVPDGRVLPFSPEITANGGVQYQFVFGDNTLTPRFQASYIGEQFATPYPGSAVPGTSTTTTQVPSRVVADVRATFGWGESLELEGFVSNVFDETYIAVQVQNASSAAGGYLYGAPRQIGARVSYKF